MEEASFRCGPYLLSPGAESMTVVWEADGACRAFGALARAGEAFGPLEEVPLWREAPEFQGRPLALFRWRLTGLLPGTDYRYLVVLEGGERLQAGFRTLPQDPEDLRMLTLSDSHAFTTREAFNQAVWSLKPHLILHSGDLVEGTGMQAEQFAFFLRGRDSGDFIHWFPVLYAQGNHDWGGPFHEAYTGGVLGSSRPSPAPGCSALDIGGLHLCLMNSNPWGLQAANALAAGESPSPGTRREIQRALEWLRQDLASPAARKALFRVLVLHHPISDALTARYIPPIAEPGGVHLVLAGHTHSFARQCSASPAVGAGTLYITQQDARMPSPRGNFCLLDARLRKGLLTLTPMVPDPASGQPLPLEALTLSAQPPQLVFQDVDISPRRLLWGDEAVIRAQAQNPGPGLAAAVLPVEDGGVPRPLWPAGTPGRLLKPGETTLLEARLPMETLGRRRLSLGGASAELEVRFRPARFLCQTPEVRLGDGTAAGLLSSQATIRVQVRNAGCTPDTQTVVLRLDGKAVAGEPLTLTPGASGEVRFAWRFDRAGTYRLQAGDGPACSVRIQGGIRGMPIVRDRSGQGHDASIHGAPRRGWDPQGRRTLILDGRRDYLETGDDGSLRAKGGVTGMVWAKLPGDGTSRPGLTELTEPYPDRGILADHNPLLVKGPGLGWGASYQFRMAVRDSGKVTYGLCFAGDGGEYGWNDSGAPEAGIQKDVWVQYTAAFSPKTGGDAYQNGFHSAHVAPPPFAAPVRNWPGEPLRIGLGFKNKVHQRLGRGTCPTLLPGEISQVRYYLRGLTEAENARLLADPEAPGPSGLQVHLRFEDEDLVLAGAHTTEWVHWQGGPVILRYRAEVPPGSGAAVSVQWSRDGRTVCREQRASLSGGVHTLSLDSQSLPWLRLRTDFLSALGEASSAIPAVLEYALEGEETILWNTQDRWRQGEFSGAAGCQDTSVYRILPEDSPFFPDP